MDDTPRITERDFELLVERVLPSILHSESLVREPRMAGSARPDFVAYLPDGKVAIVEVRLVTPATMIRLDKAARQLRALGQQYADSVGGTQPTLVLVVSGDLPPRRIEQLHAAGIDRIVVGSTLRSIEPGLPWPDFDAGQRPSQPSPSPVPGRVEALVRELAEMPPGRAEWVAYQRIVRDILAITLSPPLEAPLHESSNVTGVNRRDIILPNYTAAGLWNYMRQHYEAHYIVVDAKNYVGRVKKKDILQLANYLNAHGAGLFGIIVCRDAEDRSAEVTRREQWVIYRKLVLILNDDDLRLMLALSARGDDPAVVIRQKVEDFRLGF